MFPLGIFAHGGESGDPVLMEWIRHRIDAIIDLGPGAMVLSIGTVVVILPVVLIILFLVTQRGRQSGT